MVGANLFRQQEFTPLLPSDPVVCKKSVETSMIALQYCTGFIKGDRIRRLLLQFTLSHSAWVIDE